MGAARVLLWVLGASLVVGGLVLLYLESPLNRYVSMTMASIGLLIIVGLMVMAGATTAKSPPRAIMNQDRVVRPIESSHADTWTSPDATRPSSRPLAASVGGNAEFSGISQSQRIRPDGAVVKSTVERVVAKTPAGGRRTFTRKTKTVTKRPKRTGVNSRKGRTHRRPKQTVRSR